MKIDGEWYQTERERERESNKMEKDGESERVDEIQVNEASNQKNLLLENYPSLSLSLDQSLHKGSNSFLIPFYLVVFKLMSFSFLPSLPHPFSLILSLSSFLSHPLSVSSSSNSLSLSSNRFVLSMVTDRMSDQEK